ncbi:MAG: hypothetical protein V3S68_00925 [Dehalococcoidia bacterium]
MPLAPFMKLSQVKLEERYTFRSSLANRANGQTAVGILVHEKIKKISTYSPTEHVTGTLLTVEGKSCGESNYVEVSNLEGPWEETIEEAALQIVRQGERREEENLVRQCYNILKAKGFEVAPYEYSSTSVHFDGVRELQFLLTLLEA